MDASRGIFGVFIKKKYKFINLYEPLMYLDVRLDLQIIRH